MFPPGWPGLALLLLRVSVAIAVDVESEPGRGSAFTVLLPRHGRASQTSPAVEELPHGAGQGILLKTDVGAIRPWVRIPSVVEGQESNECTA